VADRLAPNAVSSRKKIRVAALFIAVSSNTFAQVAGNIGFDCSDYYGLNICGASFESSDSQIDFVEKNPETFTTLFEAHDPSLNTTLNDENLEQIDSKNAFRNSDSFRAYMKTLGGTDSTNTGKEFSLSKRILNNKNLGLDCRLVTNSIYELSSSNYYDCALQRYF
jgi:hypothetical protein